jgi:hypothetical protein
VPGRSLVQCSPNECGVPDWDSPVVNAKVKGQMQNLKERKKCS